MSYDPTPAMTERCEAWLKVVDTLEQYLNAASVRYDWINEATSRLSREMPQPEDLGDQFAPIGKGGIKDVFSKLWWDLNLPDGKAADSASKIIKNELLKEVESLKTDLNSSISDFREHSASFDNSLAPTKTATMRDPQLTDKVEQYQRAVEQAEQGAQPEIDPYLLKLTLDRRIDRTVRKYNSRADSYAYVQDAAKRVDGEVTERLQSILKRYTDIVERNGNIIAAGGRSIKTVFVNQPQLFEYKYWLQSNKAPATFVGSQGEKVKRRGDDEELGYPKEDSIYAQALRTGTLERRSKILRTYSPSDYVLTPLSLIELRQNKPVWSIDLRGARLLENDKAANEEQFVIEAKQHGSSSGKLHKFVFRARVIANWVRDLRAICAGKIPESLEELAKRQNQESTADHKSSAAGAAATAATSTSTGTTKQPASSTSSSAAPTSASAALGTPVQKSAAPELATSAAASAPSTEVKPATAQPVADADSVSNQVSGLTVAQQQPEVPQQPSSLASEPKSLQAETPATPPPTTIGGVESKDYAAGAGALGAGALGAGALGAAGSGLAKPESTLSEEVIDPVAAAPVKDTPPAEQTVSFVPGTSQSGPSGETDFQSLKSSAAVSVADSNRAAVGVSPPSPVESPAVSTHNSVAGGDSKAIDELSESDSDVSEVEHDFDDISDAEVPQDTLAYRAEKDMAVFQNTSDASGAVPGAVAGAVATGSAIAGGKRVEDQRFVAPADATTADDASVWSYDAKNRDEGNTLRRDPAFEPVEAERPVEDERRLSKTAHKYETPVITTTRDATDGQETSEDIVRRRRSSVGASDAKTRTARRATGSFGGEEEGVLKPLSTLTSEEKAKATNQPTLFFTESLPESTTGKQ